MILSGLITLGIVFVMFILLVIGKIDNNLIMFTTLVSLMILGVLPLNEVISDFQMKQLL